MPSDLSILLQAAIERELPHLQDLTQFEAPVGHLINSVTNNHIRFVLATLNAEFRGSGYAQDNWVPAHGYQDLAWGDLIDFRYRHNALLAHLVERMPGDVTLRHALSRHRLENSFSPDCFSGI